MARIVVISTDTIWLHPLLLELEEMEHTLTAMGMDQDALDLVGNLQHDLVLLGWGLDDAACMRYLKMLRRETVLPIFVLALEGEEARTVATLKAGADACVSMPISAGELSARIAAQLRRYDIWAQDENLSSPEPVDIHDDALVIEGRPIELSTTERLLLERLQQKSGVVVSRDELCDHVWGTDANARYTNLSLVVYNLRRKLERNPHHPRYLLTKWGVGYYISQEFGQDS